MADLNFLNTDDCTSVTFNTPTTNLQFIEYITGDVVRDYTNVDKYTITYSNNCCTGTPIDIRPLYDFVPTIDSCAIGTNIYTIELAGIHGDLIQSFLMGINPATPVVTAYTNTAGVVKFNITLVPGTVLNNITVTLTTISGFEYTIEFLITQDANPLVTCSGVLSDIVVTYPDLPTNIDTVPTVLPNVELDFNLLIGQTTITPGTYQIIICEVLYDATSTCVQNHVFIDCGSLKCQVINKWVQCIDSNIMDFYNALTWANDCTDTITYAEFCALYEILYIILTSDNCYGIIDECNCSSASHIANTLHPVAYPTSSNTTPCSTC